MACILLDMSSDVLELISSYLSIGTILTGCTVSSQFNSLLTNVNTDKILSALSTVVGWWYPHDSRKAFHKVSMRYVVESLELLCAFGNLRKGKSLYMRILQLYYIDPNLLISWNDLISNLEIVCDIYYIAGTGKGTTGNFYTRTSLLPPDWFDNQFRGPYDRYQDLMEYYVGLDAQPVCGIHVTALQIMNNWKEDPKEWELSVVRSPISFIDLTEE